MRRALLFAVGLVLSCAAADAGERYTGFLTFGCGDRYIKLRNMPQTWYVSMTAEQEREMFRLLRFTSDPNYPWLTFHVVLEARRRAAPRVGYFGVHPQQLEVERFVSVRFPSNGESVEAAMTPARLFKGLLLVGPESVGFVPLEQHDEFWWVVPGAVGWDKIYEHFQPPPDLGKNTRIDNAVVEILGRVGPPGLYGHGGEFNREIAVDTFKFVRMAEVADMVGTAAIQGEVSVGINMCKSQTR